MARALRIQFAGAFYHVFSRGNRKQRLFWDAEDYREFEDFLLTTAARSHIVLYQWRLMPNHFRFLGNQTFVDECKRKAGQENAEEQSGHSYSLDRLIECIEKHLGVSEKELQSNQRTRRIAKARRALVYVAKTFGSASGSALAQKLHKDDSAISHMFRVQQLQPEDPAVILLQN